MGEMALVVQPSEAGQPEQIAMLGMVREVSSRQLPPSQPRLRRTEFYCCGCLLLGLG